MSKNYQRTAANKCAEGKPKWNAARKQRGQTTILTMRKSWTMQGENWKWGAPQRCIAKSPNHPNGSSWERPICKWLVYNWSEQIEFFMFKARSWEDKHWIAKNSNYEEQGEHPRGPRGGPRSSFHVALHHGAQTNFHIKSRGHLSSKRCNGQRPG